MNLDFSDFPCNKCGWCCKRTPCPLGLYLGEKPLTACSFLKETSLNEFECGLITEEVDSMKKIAASNLILSGEGCSHIYGPSPVSLMRTLVANGLNPTSTNWSLAKNNTLNEYEKIQKNSEDKKSIELAIKEFKNYCIEIEASFT